MKLKMKKIATTLVISSMIVTSTNVMSINAFNYDEKNDYEFTTTHNGFKIEYAIVENNELVYYFEEVENTTIYTKKFIKDSNDKLKLVEEIVTNINFDLNTEESGEIIAEINNITNNTVITETILDKSMDSVEDNSRAIKYHPKDKNYYFVTGLSSHLFLKTLTKAAVITAIGAASGGTINSSVAIGSIAAYVVDNGISNLYYRRDSYKPIKGKGQPVAKYITKCYLDKKHTKQVGSAIYTSSDIYNK